MSFPFGALYHGTKFAVEGISESLSYEVEEFGGKVKIVEPGAIATDFSGRSFDFSNDTNLTEYQPLAEKTLAGMAILFQIPSPASVVANVIYEAATDGTDQLRYTAGEDAKVMISKRWDMKEGIWGKLKSSSMVVYNCEKVSCCTYQLANICSNYSIPTYDLIKFRISAFIVAASVVGIP